MPTRINLIDNPSLSVNAAGWFGPSGWVRTTGLTGLPRATGFAGSVAGDVVTPKFPVAPSRDYVVSVSVKATVASSGIVGVDWYDETQAYLSSTDPTTWTAGAGAVVRIEHGPVVAPAAAAFGLLAVSGVDGAAALTAAMAEQTSTTGRSYFDGDTAGASWGGDPGASLSYLLTGTDTIGVAEQLVRIAAAPGPSGVEGSSVAETVAVRATPTAIDEAGVRDSGLIVEMAYDERYGRVRLAAFTWTAGVLRVEVSSRSDRRPGWTLVRGGRVTVTDGRMDRGVDDYEFDDRGTTYLLEGVTTVEGAPREVAQRAVVVFPGGLDQAWIKFISTPFLNRRLTLSGWGPVERASRNAAFEVQGVPTPIVVTDAHTARRVTIRALTETADERDALERALTAGVPAYLHLPGHAYLPTMYVAVGDVAHAPTARRSTRSEFEIALTEVDAPPPSIVGASRTWRMVRDEHISWAALLVAYPTWRAVLD